MISLILLVFAFVFAAIAAIWNSPPEPQRGRLIAAALACFFLAGIFGNEVVSKRVGSLTQTQNLLSRK